MKTFDYYKPTVLQEVIPLLMKYKPDAKLLAGGTDLMVEIKKGASSPRAFIDLKCIPELHDLMEEEEVLRIGALVTIGEIEASPLIKQKYPILAEAAKALGSFQVRNRATLGGNICHASPAADMVPPLICLGSRLKIVGSEGERFIELEDFFLGPGKTTLGPDEILKEILVERPTRNSKGVYLKLSPRKATDLAVVGVALVLKVREGRCEDVKIVLGAVAPRALRAREAERRLIGKEIDGRWIREAAEKAMQEAAPITDVRGSDWYRREMVKVLVEKGLLQLWKS